MAQSFQLELFWQKTGFQQSSSCLYEKFLLPVEKSHHFAYKKQLSKHEDTEYFSIEVHKLESWDLLCKCFVCSTFSLGQVSQTDYVFRDVIKVHQVFTAWKKKVCRMSWNKIFSEGLELIENNVCKRYFNNIFYRLTQHRQINFFFFLIHFFFPPKAFPEWPTLHKFHMTFIWQLKRNIGSFFKRSLLSYLLHTFSFPLI